MTNVCSTRNAGRHLAHWGLTLSIAIAGPLWAQTTTPATDALKQLQQQQARDSAVRQKDINERFRQQSAATQQQAVRDPQLKRQLDETNQAQYQQYRQRREDLIDQASGLPRPGEVPVPAPASTSSARTPVQPAGATSAGGS